MFWRWPYYGTASYNEYEGGSVVKAPMYADTAALMERLSKQNNSVIYTDEAWWAKRTKATNEPNAPKDWQAGLPSLARIHSTLDRFDIVGKDIAGRNETLGVINGFRRTNEQLQPGKQQPARTNDAGSKSVVKGQAAGVVGSVEPARQSDDGKSASDRVDTGAKAEVTSSASQRASIEPAKVASTPPAEAVSSPSQPSKEISRLTGIARAVLPSAVKVEPRGDHIAITYPGGASILMRSVESVRLDPAAWYDSVAKSKGALSSAFSRAGLGALSPSKAGWMKLPKAKQQAVMAELLPVAMISDLSGRRVGLSLQAVAQLVQPAKQSDTAVADAIEEEEHHFTFSALLSDAERKIVRDDLAKRSPELLKEDPASRAVMEAAYGHWRAWRVNQQKAAVTPRVSSIFSRLLKRIQALLPFLNKVPHVEAASAVGIWEQLDAVRGRTAATPGETTDDGGANAVVTPKNESLRGEDLRKQWSKATGEQKPKAQKTWQELTQESDAKDRENGREVAYATPREESPRIVNGDHPVNPGVNSDAWLSLGDSKKKRLAESALRMGNRIADDAGKSLTNPQLMWISVDQVTPSQSGEDYDNESSRSTAKSLKKVANGGEHPYGYDGDMKPIIVDDQGVIVDGNHRHAAATFNGDREILAWVGKPYADELKVENDDQVAFSVPQALNDILPGDQRQTFEQWNKEATDILGDESRIADVRQRAMADAGLSPAEQVALRRLVSEQLSEAASSGNKNRWAEALETASLRKASGARAARELAARRLDLSTAAGRRELILSYTAEMGERWQKAYNKAKNKRDRAAVVDHWQKQQERIAKALRDKYGINLADPRLGEVFSDSYSLGRLMDSIADESGDAFHVGNLVGYYVAGNLLSAASMAVNMVGYPLMGSIAGMKGATQAIAKHLGQGKNEQVLSAEASLVGAKAGIAAMGRGLSNGALAFWTGHPQAAKQAKPLPDDDQDFSRSGSPIRNPFIRAAVAPFLEANRFVDEMAWTVAYNGALAAAAVERKNQGDQRTHEQIIALPDQELIDRAVAFADWFTLRGKPESEAGKKVFNAVNTLRSPTFGGNGPRWAVNPLYFVMPFFNAIANLTVEGAKISPYGLIASAAGVAKRSYQSVTSETKPEKDTHSSKALQNLAYALAGLGVLGMALVPGDEEDEFALKGSPRDGKSAAERSLRYAVEEPRTMNGLDVSRFDPISMPAMMHADLRDALRDVGKGKDIGPTLRNLGEKTFNAVVQRNFLSGISDLFRPQYNEDGTPKGIVTKYSENVSSMIAPGRPWISSYRKLTETERMSRERGGFDSVYDAGTARRNVFGETEKTRDDTTGSAIQGLFFTPRGEASKTAQRWQKRIYELNEALEEAGDKTWYPAPLSRSYTERSVKREWSDADYDQLQAQAGKVWLDLLEANPAIKSGRLPPKREMELIQGLRERANARAKVMRHQLLLR